MKVDLDKIPKEDIGTVLGLLNKYKDYIQSKQYANLYDKLYATIDNVFIGQITSILYESDIDPLKYMNVVPHGFLYRSSCVSGDLTIPDNITSIGNWAFFYCKGLTSVTIPDSVTSIGYEAFLNCMGLTSITFTGTKKQWNAIHKGESWNSNTGVYIIHCTDGDIHKGA